MTRPIRGIIAARATVWEDSGALLMARILGNAGTAITQASISSIALSIFNMTVDITTASATATPVIATVVFDTYQTGGPWTADDIGYNFLYTATAAQLAVGASLYRYEFLFTPASGQVFHVGYELQTEKLLRS